MKIWLPQQLPNSIRETITTCLNFGFGILLIPRGNCGNVKVVKSREPRPGDTVENYLSKLETRAAKLFASLHAAPTVPTIEQWVELNAWLALTASRHPDVMRCGYRRAKDLAYDLADISSFPTEAAFLTHMRQRYGGGLPADVYPALVQKGDELLLKEAEEIEALSPQDPKLPMLLALSAMESVAMRISSMNLHLHDAPPGKSFVLGGAIGQKPHSGRSFRPNQKECF